MRAGSNTSSIDTTNKALSLGLLLVVAGACANGTVTGGQTLAAAPAITPGTSSSSGPVTATITCSSSGSAPYVTTNGTVPTTSSTQSGTATFTSSGTLEAICVGGGYFASPVASATYTINGVLVAAAPAITPGTSSSPGPVTATITCSSSGSAPYVTTNGTVPTTSSTQSGTATFTSSGTLEAICAGGGFAASPVTSATYTVASAATYSLTVSLVGWGTVTSSSGGITCGTSCSADYAAGASVILTADPGVGYTFTGWSGGPCSGIGTCAVTMSGTQTVTAIFTGNSRPTPLPGVTLTGGNQPVAVPFVTWTTATVAVAPSTTGNTFYVDGAHGDDTHSGSLTAPLKTIGASLSLVSAGDTVLIRKGLYREVVELGSTSGVSGKPITFGAYGDGEVIVDGSIAVTGWTNHSGTVWKVSVAGLRAALEASGVPLQIDAVVVNNVPLMIYSTTTAIPASGSGQWYFDGNSTLYADMGAVDPTSATADVMVVPFNHGASTISLGSGSYLNIIGLTIRGSGWSGIWSYQDSSTPGPNGDSTVGGQYVTIAYCDIKFNDGPGFAFNGGSNNAVLYSHVYHNVLNNWPFGNNLWASYGGGWPGGSTLNHEANPVARGNVVALNGGEGLAEGDVGTANGLPVGNVLLEENVTYDNWSVNIYICNGAHHVVRNNLVFNHKLNPAIIYPAMDLIIDGESGRFHMEKFRSCIALGDEGGGSFPPNTSTVRDTQIYNNVIVGCRYGIQDYSEAVTVAPLHGMRNDFIVNNTVIMDSSTYSIENIAGIIISDNGNNNSNTIFANNIIYRPVICDASLSCPLVLSLGTTPFAGIAITNNLYFGYGTASSDGSLFDTGSGRGFADWHSYEGLDATNKYQDPLLVGEPDVAQPTGVSQFDYNQCMVGPGSPAKGLGMNESSVFTGDFTGAIRGASWTAGAFE